MRQVAVLAGVGIKTVSRVVNGEPNVSEAMIQRVQEAVQSLDYELDVNAGNLRRLNRRTLTLGLLLGDFANPFSGAVQQGIEQKARERDTAVLAASFGRDPDRGRAVIRTFTRRGVDGMILAGAARNAAWFAPDSGFTPAVFIGQAPPGTGEDAVKSDDFTGAAAAARHLLGHGHRRIAYCCTNDYVDPQASWERQRGFMAEVARAGVPAAELHVIRDVADAEQARKAVGGLLRSESPPTAIFASDSVATIGAMRALRECGLTNSVALVGFDDFALPPELADPWVTVVVQEPECIGRVAAEILFARIDGSRQEPQTYTVPTTLIARGSGEIRAGVREP